MANGYHKWVLAGVWEQEPVGVPMANGYHEWVLAWVGAAATHLQSPQRPRTSLLRQSVCNCVREQAQTKLT